MDRSPELIDESELLNEMLDYCISIQNYSYYELKYYAIKNRPDWMEVLNRKKPRVFMSLFLKNARHECKKKGIPQPTLLESIERIHQKEDKQ